MQTMRLAALQAPSRIQTLLESLLLARLMPDGARRITDRHELPSSLQKIVIKGCDAEKAWIAWTDEYVICLFTAEMSLELSRERGCATLNVGRYDMSGKMREWQIWAMLNDGTWQRCAA